VQFILDDPLEKEIILTLEDTLQICYKEIQYKDNSIDLDGNERVEDKDFVIEIPPGVFSGATYCYPRMGYAKPGRIACDFRFTVRVKQHAIFTRTGSNLQYIARLTQLDIQRGQVEVPTLEGGTKLVQIAPTAQHNGPQRIAGLGLPLSNNPHTRGDLIVRFELIQPENDKQLGKGCNHVANCVSHHSFI